MTTIVKLGSLEAAPETKTQGLLEVPATNVRMPLTLAHGARAGTTLLVTAGIHGGEYASIEAAIRFAHDLRPEEMSGRILVLPIVSAEAFHARTQYVHPADGKNVNRQFPGRALGTVSERIAHTVTTEAASRADAWIDLHSGDLHEALVPVVGYLEEGEPSVQERSRAMAEVFGIDHLMHPKDLPGTTFKTAVALGVPCIIAEAGERGQSDEESIARLVRGMTNVARHLGILPGPSAPRVPVPAFRDYPWIRAEQAGCWYPAVRVGELVRRDERIGVIKDYFGTVLAEYAAPADGMVLLLATSLAMNPGDPLFGVGVR